MADVGETTQVSDLKLGVEKVILGCASFIVSSYLLLWSG